MERVRTLAVAGGSTFIASPAEAAGADSIEASRSRATTLLRFLIKPEKDPGASASVLSTLASSSSGAEADGSRASLREDLSLAALLEKVAGS